MKVIIESVILDSGSERKGAYLLIKPGFGWGVVFTKYPLSAKHTEQFLLLGRGSYLLVHCYVDGAEVYVKVDEKEEMEHEVS